jgi:CubicO group peptidase (beta-lactamase class C family)
MLSIPTAYLQLVDRGILTLDTDMTQFDERLKKAASQRLVTFVDGKPIYEPNEVPIRLRDMLNNTSGFAAEMGPLYQQWRALPDNPRGFVLGCKLVSAVLHDSGLRSGLVGTQAHHRNSWHHV